MAIEVFAVSHGHNKGHLSRNLEGWRSRKAKVSQSQQKCSLLHGSANRQIMAIWDN